MPEAVDKQRKSVGGDGVEAASGKRGLSRHKAIIAVVALAIAVVAAIAAALAFGGDRAPQGVAAEFAGSNRILEQEVSDYIATYRRQMGMADVSDKEWAAFLAAYNLTPERLRESTVRQLVKDKLVQINADELGLSVSDEEIDAAIAVLRDTTALGDGAILAETIESHGQTLEGVREVYRQAILKRKVLTAEVEKPEPTDEQVKAYMKSYDSSLETPTVRHTYCFRLKSKGDGFGLKETQQVERLRDEFAAGDKTPDAFGAIVQQYSNDEELKPKNGANGWDADTSAYGNEYLEALQGLEKGDVSVVFREGKDALAFIWVSDAFTLPVDADAIDALDLSAVPPSLCEYLSDSAAHELWEAAGSDYLDQLLEDSNVIYYPMPADVPYNADVSLADVQLEEVGEAGE